MMPRVCTRLNQLFSVHEDNASMPVFKTGIALAAMVLDEHEEGEADE
jgi:hypothetical protein